MQKRGDGEVQAALATHKKKRSKIAPLFRIEIIYERLFLDELTRDSVVNDNYVLTSSQVRNINCSVNYSAWN